LKSKDFVIGCKQESWADYTYDYTVGSHLFVKVPRPGDSEVTIRVKLPPVTTSLTTQR